MSSDISDRLLERYCAGDCEPAEKAEVEAWAAADPAHAETLALLMAAWRGVGVPAAPAERPDVRAAWSQVQRRIERGDRPPLRLAVVGEPQHRRTWRRLLAPGAAVAATVTLLIGGGLMATRLTHRSVGDVLATAPMREIVTQRGQRSALDLPDGSRVVLAAASRLRIPQSYSPAVGPRDVWLEGEAYFEVTHNAARPFRVHAANGIAEDLGTEFVVTAYPETKGLEVVVATGSVALWSADTGQRHPRALLTLMRGELGRLDSTGTAVLTRGVSLAPRVAWVTGSLVFDGARMGDVIARLARWYDLDIRLADADLADRRLTVTFRQETAEQALDHVALALGADVEWTGRVVVLRDKHR